MIRRLPLLLAAFGALALCAAILGYFYTASRDALLVDAEKNLRAVAAEAAEETSNLFQPARLVADQLDDAGLPDLDIAEVERLFFAIASSPVRANSQIAGVYVGLVDGSFLHVQSLIPTDLTAPGALPAGYDGLIRRVLRRTAASPTDAWLYRDGRSGEWMPSLIPPSTYDPRERPWYRNAVERNGLAWSDPYVFASSGEVGITLAMPIYTRSGGMWGVIGVDITVSSLSQLILDYRERRVGQNGFLFVGNAAGRLIAHSRLLDAIWNVRQGTTAMIEAATDIRNVHRPNADDLVLFNAITATGPIYSADNSGREVLGGRLPLHRALRIPMFIYIGQPVDDIVGVAIVRLRQSIAVLAVLIAVILIVATYAAKLRREVTIRKRTEIALAQARDVAEEATRAKSSFLAMMSHEIRTPMNGVMTMAEMLDQTELTDDQRSMSSVIRGSSLALLTIINDILDFSKIEAGKLDIEKVPFSLLDTVDAVGDLIGGRAEEKGIGLVIDLDPGLPDKFTGDPARLRQILLNLMGNAVKFTETGEVVLRVTSAAADAGSMRLRFEVVDSGIGLTAEQQKRLFQAFSQADTSTSRKYGGTGLGLSISQRLCELMGGTIGVTSSYGEGSTFWFELPFGAEARAADTPAIKVADAQIAVLGFEATEQHVMATLLRAAGIDDPLWHPIGPPFDGVLAERSIILVRADTDTRRILDLVPLIPGNNRPDRRVILLASRGLGSTLSAATQQGYFATLTLPVRRHRLWHVIAAAMGRAELALRQAGASDDAIGWAPPAVEVARDAGVLILVAEDNSTNQTVIRRLLNQRGFAHEIAGNGVEALRFLERGGYGLLLTDFHMPEMDGFQLTREIRQREKDSPRRLPIIALTADALPGTEQKCLAAGMDGYLTKPIDSRALTTTLQKFLPQALPLRQRDGAAARTATGPKSVDPAVIDLGQVAEIFGGLNDDAYGFLAGFVDDLPRMIGDVAAALLAGDQAAARDAAHALKGAARSSGINRLGQIASDIQDHLDNRDLDAAVAAAPQLTPALEELRSAIQRLNPAAVHA